MRLDISGALVSAAGLAALRQLTCLEALSLDGTVQPDTGALHYLAHLTRLTYLQVCINRGIYRGIWDVAGRGCMHLMCARYFGLRELNDESMPASYLPDGRRCLSAKVYVVPSAVHQGWCAAAACRHRPNMTFGRARVQVGGSGPGLLAAASGLTLLAHLSVSYYNSMRALDRVALLDALPLLRRCPRLSRVDLLYMPIRAEQVRPLLPIAKQLFARAYGAHMGREPAALPLHAHALVRCLLMGRSWLPAGRGCRYMPYTLCYLLT